MIEIEAALALVTERACELESERVPLSGALGRILREDVVADLDSPPFDAAAMDGYAVRPPAPVEGFRCVGEVAAGSGEEFSLKAGECVRIFTGGRVPTDAERVVMQEKAKRTGELVQVLEAESPTFIRKRGENCRRGDVVVRAGHSLMPVDLAAVSSCGVAEPDVTRRARVLHIVTGRELVAPDQKPTGTQIRDSNSILVSAFLKAAGAELAGQIHVGDELEKAQTALSSAKDVDLVLISGGAAVGRFDYAKHLLVGAGFELVFEKINLRPGKPLIFAVRENQLAFAIPGNPVSHWVVLELIIAAALRKLHGDAARPRLRRGRLKTDLSFRPDLRQTYWPCRAESDRGEYVLTPLRFVSSGDIMGLAGANALIPIAPNEKVVSAKTPIDFLLCSHGPAMAGSP